MTTLPPAARDEWVENTPRTGRLRLNVGEIWNSRELAFFFAVRDIKVRYKQALLGGAWAVLQPLIGAATFTLLFNGLADIDVEGVSYFPFALVGFVVWSYISSAVGAGASSIAGNADLLTKVAFPPIVIPMSVLLPGFIDFVIGATLAIGAALIVGEGLSLAGIILGIPLGMLILVLAAIGPVLFFSAVTVRYRDAQVFAGFGLQILLFASPIAYPPELVPDRWRSIYYANPLAGALGSLRAGLVGQQFPAASDLALSAAVAVGLAVLGLVRFRRGEPEFADII